MATDRAGVTVTDFAQSEFVVLVDALTLARCAADWLLDLVRAAGHIPAVCLSGGSTPLLFYETLSTPAYRYRFPWQRIHWFWGDERFVAADHERSNYRAAKSALFDHVPVPEENIHPIMTESTLEAAAENYEFTLRQFYKAPELSIGHSLFAATLLGVGTDGHVASLFPGDDALQERARWVVAVPEAKPERRITLTLLTLASTSEIAFLVSGTSKREILARIRRGEDVPALRIKSTGRTHWFVDRAAAGIR